MSTPLELLLPYQRRWVTDDSRFKIGLMARQIGKSFACACEAVLDCVLHPGTQWVILSAGERQALEFMLKARQWAEALQLTVDSYTECRDSAQSLVKSAEIRWNNRSRLLALPANPDTARGYSANLILDEFAFHENPEEIWRSTYPSISNPLRGKFKLRIVSTPNGIGNKFHDLWISDNSYSKHFIDIHTAVREGLPLNLDELRAGLDDPDGWVQEFECQFIDTSSVLLPYELIAACESPDTTEIFPKQTETQNLFIGIDIGRKHDLTVAWVLEKIGDVCWTREVRILDRTPFHHQLENLSPLCEHATQVCVDATGSGAMLAEELARKHGSRIRQISFTAETKASLFTGLRRSFDERTLRIPPSREIREDLHGIQKVAGQGGIRYLATHTEDGHSDRAAALALALQAASNRTTLQNFTPSAASSARTRWNELRRDRSLLI